MDLNTRPYEFIIVTDGDPDHLPPKVFEQAIAEFVEVTKEATCVADDGVTIPAMSVSFLPLLTTALPPRIITTIANAIDDHPLQVDAYSYSYGDTMPSAKVKEYMPQIYEWPDEGYEEVEVDGREQIILLAVGQELDGVREFIEAALQRGYKIFYINEGLWQLDAITELEQPMSEIDSMQAEYDALTAAEQETPPVPVKPKVKMKQPATEPPEPTGPVSLNLLTGEMTPVTPAGEHDGQQGEHPADRELVPPSEPVAPEAVEQVQAEISTARDNTVLNPEWEAMGRNELRDLVKERGLHPTDFRSKASLLDCLYGREPSVKPERRSPLKKKQDEVEAMSAMDAEIPAIIKALKAVLEEEQDTIENQKVVLAKLEALLVPSERVGES